MGGTREAFSMCFVDEKRRSRRAVSKQHRERKKNVAPKVALSCGTCGTRRHKKTEKTRTKPLQCIRWSAARSRRATPASLVVSRMNLTYRCNRLLQLVNNANNDDGFQGSSSRTTRRWRRTKGSSSSSSGSVGKGGSPTCTSSSSSHSSSRSSLRTSSSTLFAARHGYLQWPVYIKVLPTRKSWRKTPSL